MVKSILKTADSQELPENLQDAQALAGLLQQVANESVVICKNIDPGSVPGNTTTDLAEKTNNMIGMLTEMKTKQYQANPQQSPTPTPTSTSTPTSAFIPVQNNYDTSQLEIKTTSSIDRKNSKNDNIQLELNLNPTSTECIINLLERIEYSLSKIYALLEKADKREVEMLSKKATKKLSK